MMLPRLCALSNEDPPVGTGSGGWVLEVAVRNRKWHSGSCSQGRESDRQEQEVAVHLSATGSDRLEQIVRSQKGSGSPVFRNRKWRTSFQEQEVAAQLSGTGSGGPVVRNRKVLGVLSKAVEMDQLQWRRCVIGFCAVGKWC